MPNSTRGAEWDGAAARPFTIAIPDSTLDDLRERLSRTRWPDQVDGATWEYGTDLAYLRELCAYWRDRYDWRAQEAALNGFRQFTARVDGIDLHFIHEPGEGPNPRPLPGTDEAKFADRRAACCRALILRYERWESCAGIF